MNDLFRAIEIADKMRADVMAIESFEAYGALLGALTDEWCVRHNMSPNEVWEGLAIVSKQINEALGPYKVEEA